VVWEKDGKYPGLIIDLLSNSTATVDWGFKKDLYQERFQTHESFWFSPETLEFAGFRLISQKDQSILLNAFGWLWSETLELYLGMQNEQLWLL
jgi:Uma2 family endonuclease